jgi:glucosamine-6-phosphate deaminase
MPGNINFSEDQPMPSTVEERALQASGQPLRYAPREKIGVIVVPSFPSLGTLAALRFLEWVQANPEGVISLPTGKSPEYFIKEVNRLLRGWDSPEVRGELETRGLAVDRRPDLRGLHFVQIDEFYPTNPLHHNSFHYYVQRYYIDGFGLDPQRALLIDCSNIGLPAGVRLEDAWPDDRVDLSLRYRTAASHLEELQKRVIEQIDEWCNGYEAHVRRLGGIGFFLGGIGPDGHVGFNVRGSGHFSTTRLAEVNYETQAAAAGDLGGIEIARRRLVITVGLATITYNPECTAIIIAAGEAKSRVVADAVQCDPHVRYPATALHRLDGARFYLTQGAAKGLDARCRARLETAEGLTEEQIEKILVDLSLGRNKRIESLTAEEIRHDPDGALALTKSGRKPAELTRGVADRLRSKIESGTELFSGCVFLHTEPHHDDLMLGYLPFIVRHIRDHSTRHYFSTLTSGFTAVTNRFMLRQLQKLKVFIRSEAFERLASEDYFDPTDQVLRNRDVWQYLDGVAADSRSMREDGECRRLYRNLVEIYDERERETLEDRIDELINYFETQYPGKKDLGHIQKLKGMCREWEADCLWGYFGWSSESVRHLRLGFYQGEIFTEEPTIGRDVLPVLHLLREVKPDVITLALDPEASGPDTHYKVLQAITEALKLYEEESGRSDLVILGYRNVWYRFHPSEADLFVPVSLNMFSLQQSAFTNTFISQKEASFPSYEHDGPFSELAQKIQVDQYQKIKCCLGREQFYEHPSALIRATRGFVFLKKMTLEELYERSRELARSTENL